MTKDRVVEICDMIMQDMKNDAEELDGQPFTSGVVAEAFGKQGAAIAALANLIKHSL